MLPRLHLRTFALAGLLLAVLLTLAVPRPALASKSQLAIMMDDDQLLYRGDSGRTKALIKMKQLGVDVIRATVLWRYVAEGVHLRKHGKKVDLSNPRSYPAGNWDRYDRLVRDARALGMDVFFNVTGAGPPYSRGKAPKGQKVVDSYKPNAHQFFLFMEALGKRYSGSYHDENENQILPRMRVWSIWNEPNQGFWLAPQVQFSKKLGKEIPYSPVLYRNLYWAAVGALKKTGHGNDVIYMGETAPIGNPLSPPDKVQGKMRPGDFIRELFCLDPHFRPYQGAEADARGCGQLAKHGGFQPTGWAHHPYNRGHVPTQGPGQPWSYTTGNLHGLESLLDKVAATTHYIRPGLPLLLTEFGYETDPPDPYHGISPAKQADYLNTADWVAYRDPRVLGTTQFLLRDVAAARQYKKGSRRYWYTFQSGLFNAKYRPKPSALAFAFPFVLHRRPGQVLDVWGQLRFRPNYVNVLSKPDNVYLQYRPPGGNKWTQNFGPFAVNDPFGYFNLRVKDLGRGSWRAVWFDFNSPPYQGISREIRFG